MEEIDVGKLALTQEYINGLLHMASSCSGWIGRSEITAVCYSASAFQAEFAAEYDLSPEALALIKEPISFRQELARWIGGQEAKITEGLYWLFHHRLGDPLQVLRLEKEESLISGFGWGEGGKGPYYFVEDLFFVQFKGVYVCLFLGNNE